jgi:helicase
VRLRGIGRVRARRLFNNNITSPDAVLTAGIDAVTKIIGRGISEQIFTQLEDKKTADSRMTGGNVQREQRSSDENDNNGQATLSHFR